MKNWGVRAPKIISAVSKTMESVIAVVLMIVIAYLFVEMVWDYSGQALAGEGFAFNVFLLRAIDLVIGIEFAKMLYRQTPDTVIDVLMFATARQAVLDHTRILENLLAVIAIAILFVLRMYVIPGKAGKGDAAARLAGKFRKAKEPAPETASAGSRQCAAETALDQ